jgi:hypothetical protein
MLQVMLYNRGQTLSRGLRQSSAGIPLIVTKAFLEMCGRFDFTLRTIVAKLNYNLIYLSVSLRAFSCTFKETPNLGITLQSSFGH